VFLCLVALVVIAVFVVPKIIGGEEKPAAPPTVTAPPTDTPAMEATTTAPPTDTPTVEATTAAPPTEAPTAEVTAAPPPPETPTVEASPTVTPTLAFDARVGIIPSTFQLQQGDLLTITVTITNTGNVSFGLLRFQLLGEWTPYLAPLTEGVVGHEESVEPGASAMATFVLEAVRPGTATFQANVTMEVDEPPRWESRSSETISVSIEQP